MGWEALILLHALCSALGTIQARGIARNKYARKAALYVNAITFGSLYIVGLLLLPLIGGVHFETAFSDPVPLLASALFFNIGLYYLYRALVYLESATVAVLATLSVVFSLIFARIIFHEQLTTTQIIGTTVLLPCIGYVLLLARKRQKFVDFKDLSWVRGAVYVVISSLALALGHVMEKDLVFSIGIGNYVAFGWFLQATLAILAFVILGNKSKKLLMDRYVLQSSAMIGLLRVGAALFFLYALRESNNLSLVMVVSNFRIIVVAVLAGWLLKERRFYYRKLVAAALSLVGLSIIFWA